MKTIKKLGSYSAVFLVAVFLLGFIADWDIVGVGQFIASTFVSAVTFVKDLLVESEIFRGIFS